MMTAEQIAPGVKFVDDSLVSQPPEYRVHRIEDVTPGKPKTFTAVHLASGTSRVILANKEALSDLQAVPDFLVADANFQALVGEQITLFLKDGNRITGVCTAVVYVDIVVSADDEQRVYRQIGGIELDGTGATRFGLDMIERIVRQ
jgi:hypothetical protein